MKAPGAAQRRGLFCVKNNRDMSRFSGFPAIIYSRYIASAGGIVARKFWSFFIELMETWVIVILLFIFWGEL